MDADRIAGAEGKARKAVERISRGVFEICELECECASPDDCEQERLSVDAALTQALRLASAKGAWEQHVKDRIHIHDSPNWTYTGCEAESALQAIIDEIEKAAK